MSDAFVSSEVAPCRRYPVFALKSSETVRRRFADTAVIGFLKQVFCPQKGYARRRVKVRGTEHSYRTQAGNAENENENEMIEKTEMQKQIAVCTAIPGLKSR